MGSDPNELPVVLVTGFGPFQCYDVNPASVTLKVLETLQYPDEIRLVTKEVPVEYETVSRELPNLWAKYRPKLVVHIGTGSESETIFAEKQAFNYGYISKDMKNNVPCDNLCCSNGMKILRCKLDLDSIVKKVNESEAIPIKFETSEDPGRYLCSFIYYKSLSIDPDRSIFIHVPPFKGELNEQNYASCIRLLILILLRHMKIIS